MRYRTLFTFSVLLLLMTILIPMANAQSSVEATIASDALNVRSTPQGDPVGTLNSNTPVTVTGREDQQGNGGVWVLVSGAGVQGWVLSDFVQFPDGFRMEDLPVVTPDGTVVSNDSGGGSTESGPARSIPATMLEDSNVRGGPGTSFPRVAGIGANANATLNGRNGDSSWVRGFFNGTEGWVLSGLVNPGGSITVLPVVNGLSGEAPAPAQQTTEAQPESAPAAANVPPPVSGGSGIGGFAFGAHIAHMGNADLMASMGMSWMKIQIRYNRGDNPDNYAGMINEAHALGFRLLLGVVGSPGDIAADGDNYFADYANFVGGLARNGVDAVEVWNEPNLDREWPVGSVDPAQYTRLLAASYNAIKSNNGNTVVISGAPAPTGFFGGCTPNGCDDSVFLAGMASAGAARYMDCVGAHYNEGIVPPSATSGDPRSNYFTRYFFGMVNTYARTIGKPVCFTELGYVTPDGYGGMPPGFEWGNENTIEEHAQWLAEAISLGRRSSNVRLIIIWNLNITSAPGSPDPSGGYAMIRPDGSCPACSTVAGR